MKFGFWVIFILWFNSGFVAAQCSFKTAHLAYPRVKNAYKKYELGLKKEIKQRGLSLDKPFLVRAFKQESQMEIWLYNAKTGAYSLFKEWKICEISGQPGPKIMEGDGQTPEGFYQIDAFNPQSTYHLSLRVNYPNSLDRAKASSDTKLGGSIMIHGECVTIGCLPMTNPIIEQLYLLAVENYCKTNKQAVQVHIFPFRFDNTKNKDAKNPNYSFWKNLQTGYDFFENSHQLPNVKIDNQAQLYGFE